MHRYIHRCTLTFCITISGHIYFIGGERKLAQTTGRTCEISHRQGPELLFAPGPLDISAVRRQFCPLHHILMYITAITS